MLENLLSLEEINRRPFLVFFWALIIGVVGILISIQVSFDIPGPSSGFNLSGLFAVLFTIIPSIPFIIMLINNEEIKEEDAINHHYSQDFWHKHGKDVMVMLFFFAGITLAFAIFSFALPGDTFQVQDTTINAVRGATGAATGMVSAADEYGLFMAILLNNLQVMMFSFLFSFAFGAGAVFIIVWNASVLGVFIGNLSKHILDLPLVSLLFIPHGIPEIAGYLFAGLAGGIISAALVRKIPNKTLEIIMLDSFKMLTIGVALILIAAGIEVYL